MKIYIIYNTLELSVKKRLIGFMKAIAMKYTFLSYLYLSTGRQEIIIEVTNPTTRLFKYLKRNEIEYK